MSPSMVSLKKTNPTSRRSKTKREGEGLHEVDMATANFEATITEKF